ncbi:MAG: hypothetical protein F4Y67_02350 [Chloroflexi bacterium]|nr:hypothetical protein [Chloroflexota bacterium]MXX67320.1 hypothetical protein [Chloroflexota bacterium]MXX99649.1 hypothetical protein [Chloroflexota bacterium]MXY13435.1 hypothetical protein [Chloroflexota bacterium]
MRSGQKDAPELAAGESWDAIHQTLERSHRSLYLAGTASILLLWGVLTSGYFLVSFALGELAPEFVADYPWYHGPIWAVLGPVGMVGSMVIGHRASERNAGGRAARNAGIRVFLYWLAIAMAAGVIPGVAGMWNSVQAENIPSTILSVIFLGYLLFGILFRPALAVVGVALAAAVIAPHHLAGDWADLVSGLAVLTICGLGVVWIRRSGHP